MQEADAIVHFSAVNPYPNASWSESAQSMDHCFYIFQLAVLCKGEIEWWRCGVGYTTSPRTNHEVLHHGYFLLYDIFL